MKKHKILMIIAFFGMLLSSCEKQTENGDNDTFIDKPNSSKKEIDTHIADLPSLVKNTDYIVFTVKSNEIQKRNKSASYDSRGWYNNYLDNLIFQNINTDETHLLTKKKIKIISYERLVDSINPTLNTTLFQVIDSFPKNEKEETFTALYLSTNEGENFTKITKLNEHLTSWKYIPETKNIYFTTTDDINSNRKFDDKDREAMHSVSVNSFKRKDLLVEELKKLN